MMRIDVNDTDMWNFRPGDLVAQYGNEKRVGIIVGVNSAEWVDESMKLKRDNDISVLWMS